MSIATLFIVSVALFVQAVPKMTYFLPTSTVVRVAGMAARDEGYEPGARGTFLDELRKNGKEPILSYTSIGLYKEAHLARYYSIREETGDIADPMLCKLFRYPDLVKFNRETMKAFGTKEASLEVIATEIGCDKLEIVPSNAPTGSSK
jgi:hypothetical protein